MAKNDDQPREKDVEANPENGGRFASKDGGGGSSHDTKPTAKTKQISDTVKKQRDTTQEAEGDEETAAPAIDKVLGKEIKGVKGQAAIERLMQERQGHVKGAFHRDDIGDIDLVWGNDDLGLQHILTRRQEQGIDTDEFVKDLAEVIEKGTFRKKNNRGNFEFMHNGKIAVISPELQGEKITFLLTAFKTHSKK